MKNQKAFTLLEILLVIAVIAILAGIVIVAINPGRQLAQARNAERSSDLRALHSAVQQYYIDNKAWPTSTMPSTLTEICDENGNPAGCLNLNDLVPTYLSAIPRDPSLDDTAEGTNYKLAINPNTNMPELIAPSSTEYDLDPIQVGTTTAMTFGEVISQIPTDGLVSYWSFDGNADDEWGTNDGVVDGATLTTGVGGVAGTAYSFDGVNNYISVPHSSDLDMSGPLTVSAWVKLKSDASCNEIAYPLVVGKMGDYTGYALWINPDCSIRAVVGDGTWRYQSTGYVPSFSVWNHFSLVYTGTTADLYVDGEFYSSISTGGIIQNSNDLVFAKHYSQSVFTDVNIDEVRIYDRALGGTEIQTIYNIEKPSTVTSLRDGLVGYWPLDETSGSTAYDESINNNNGDLLGGVLINQTGKVGQAMSFDGSDDYIKLINDSDNFPINNSSRTISMWVKPTSVRGTAMWYGYYGTAYQEMDMEIGYPSGGIPYWQRYDSDLSGGTATNDDDWHFVVFRHDQETGDVSNIWVDGVKDSADISNILDTPSSEVSIGASLRASSVSFYYQGLIDEVAIWDRALSDEEISSLHNNGNGRSLVQ